jgi:hypothetical protein
MRFFTIFVASVCLAITCGGCVESMRGEAVLTHSAERMYVRHHSIDLRFVLNGRVVEYGTVTVTQVPGLTDPPTTTWQIHGGYARVQVPVACRRLEVRVSIGALPIQPIVVLNKDGTYTLTLTEEKGEGQP